MTSSQRELGSVCHIVRLIEDHELGTRVEELLRPGEVLDLLSHDINASVIRSIQLLLI